MNWLVRNVVVRSRVWLYIVVCSPFVQRRRLSGSWCLISFGVYIDSFTEIECGEGSREK